MTTLIAPLPRANRVLAPVRLEHDWSARRGVPAHVTLFGPFVPPAEMTPELLERLRELFVHEAALRISLDRLGRLGDTACLFPDAWHALAGVTERLGRLRPDLRQRVRRYHVTVARACSDTLLARVSAEVQPHLPIADWADVAELVERRGDGTVRTVARFRFACGATGG